MAKISKYDDNLSISLSDKLIGTKTTDSNSTKNHVMGDLVTFIMSEVSGYGFYKIGDYMVDRKGGTNTTIETGNIIYGIGSFAPNEYIIAVALIDDPQDIDDSNEFEIRYRG